MPLADVLYRVSAEARIENVDGYKVWVKLLSRLLDEGYVIADVSKREGVLKASLYRDDIDVALSVEQLSSIDGVLYSFTVEVAGQRLEAAASILRIILRAVEELVESSEDFRNKEG